MTRPVLLFDVNETLLDVTSMGPAFEQTFNSPTFLGEWFSTLLRFSLEVSVSGDYHPFDELARSALTATAARHGKQLDDATVGNLLAKMTELPAHPDVRPGLEALKSAGFRIMALTNSRHETAVAQLTFAGIVSEFDEVLTVESVRKFKPAPETYAYAAEQAGVSVDQLMMIAAHDWDVNGALLAGAQAAFLERPGVSLAPHDRIPDLRAPELVTLSNKIIETHPK